MSWGSQSSRAILGCTEDKNGSMQRDSADPCGKTREHSTESSLPPAGQAGRRYVLRTIFFLSSEGRKAELCYLFRARNQILGIEWNSIETKKPEENVDWRPFCEYIRGHLLTVQFLFEPPEVWDKTWFARTISETAEKVPVRREIVDLVKAAGHEITGKQGWFGTQSWSLADEEVIRRVAFAHWVEWRERRVNRILKDWDHIW